MLIKTGSSRDCYRESEWIGRMCCAVVGCSDVAIRAIPVSNDTVHVSSGTRLSPLASSDQTRPLTSPLPNPFYHTDFFKNRPFEIGQA